MDNHPTDPEHRGADIPPAVGTQLRIALGLDETPATLGEWIDAVVSLVGEADTIGMDELCTAESSRHTARLGETTHYFHCVSDAIMVPLVVDEVDRITIHSGSPLIGTVVMLQVTADEITATPKDTVISIGVTTDIDTPATDDFTPQNAYEYFCPSGNAFPSRTEYEQWATETSAETMAISIEVAHELAQAIGRANTET